MSNRRFSGKQPNSPLDVSEPVWVVDYMRNGRYALLKRGANIKTAFSVIYEDEDINKVMDYLYFKYEGENLYFSEWIVYIIEDENVKLRDRLQKVVDDSERHILDESLTANELLLKLNKYVSPTKRRGKKE
jgi:hypothetical protein